MSEPESGDGKKPKIETKEEKKLVSQNHELTDENTYKRKRSKIKSRIQSIISLGILSANRDELICQSISRGIVYCIGRLTNMPDRDILFQDFHQVDVVQFTKGGTTLTPASDIEHTLGDYAQNGFKYFRNKFGISSELFMISFSNGLKQISNPGASGSLFYVTRDDQFIVKTLDKREAKFLIGVLPGYYMNLQQNQDTTLPKFYGLYKFGFLFKSLHIVVMNNLLPSSLKFHEKYDLKGSTFKRKANEKELSKKLPTLKDLDFTEKHPKGFLVSEEVRQSIMDILNRDVRVLQSFKIMDFSLLLVVHNKTIYDSTHNQAGYDVVHGDQLVIETVQRGSKLKKQLHSKYKNENSPNEKKVKNSELLVTQETKVPPKSVEVLNIHKNIKQDIDYISYKETSPEDKYKEYLKKGIPARDENGNEVYLYIGIIDILQNYRTSKKAEHTFKSIFQPGDRISVNKPKFYASRFLDFCGFIFQSESTRCTYDEHSNRKKKSKKPLQQNMSSQSNQPTNDNSGSIKITHSEKVKKQKTQPPVHETNKKKRTNLKKKMEM